MPNKKHVRLFDRPLYFEGHLKEVYSTAHKYTSQQ